MRKVFLLVLMLAAVVGTQYKIARDRADVVVSHEHIAGNPVDRYAAIGKAQGTVVVAHGFAGSKELMQYWGYALARQGFDTYLFDQPGHGEQTRVLPAWRDLANNPLGQNLRAILSELTRTGRAEPGKIALIGHSMGGTTVVAAGLVEPAVAATVAISPALGSQPPAGKPDNLLSLVAERDPDSIRAAVTALAAQTPARTTVEVAGRNHLTILYDEAVMEQAAAWIHTALKTQQPGPVRAGVPWNWILLALAGGLGAILMVAWLLSPPTLRTKARQPALSGFTGLAALSVAALSAVLAVVYLRTPWVGVAVLDYLLPYFLVAAVVLRILRHLWPRDFTFALTQGTDTVATAIFRGLGVALAYLGALVPVVHMNLTHYIPVMPRLLPLVITAVVLWLYFVQEEGLKRAVSARRGPAAGLALGLAGKAIIIGTWLGAAALPNPPGFLTLTIPIAAVMLLVLELLSAVLGQMRYSSTSAATLTALALAWTLASTFPLV